MRIQRHLLAPRAPAARCRLLAACEDGFDLTARALLHNGAKVDAQCKGGETALITACHFGHVQTTRMVLAAGASVNLADGKRMSALMHLCLYPHPNDDDLIKIEGTPAGYKLVIPIYSY